MRLLVMFDLPTKTKRDKDRYIRFKRFLEDDGYMREQNSIYTRSLLSRSSAGGPQGPPARPYPARRQRRGHRVDGETVR